VVLTKKVSTNFKTLVKGFRLIVGTKNNNSLGRLC